jgi:hypothetical protein
MRVRHERNDDEVLGCGNRNIAVTRNEMNRKVFMQNICGTGMLVRRLRLALRVNTPK